MKNQTWALFPDGTVRVSLTWRRKSLPITKSFADEIRTRTGLGRRFVYYALALKARRLGHLS